MRCSFASAISCRLQVWQGLCGIAACVQQVIVTYKTSWHAHLLLALQCCHITLACAAQASSRSCCCCTWFCCCVAHSMCGAIGMVTVMDGSESGPFNIGNPTEFTMLELAQMVQQVVNPNVKIVYKENTADDPSRRKPDITKVLLTAWMLRWCQPIIVQALLCIFWASRDSVTTCARYAAAFLAVETYTAWNSGGAKALLSSSFAG